MAGGKSILVDTTLCIGCYSCFSACKQWNNLPPAEIKESEKGCMPSERRISAQNWNCILGRTDEKGPVFFPFMCLHCSDAPCVSACPEKAIVQDEGWTLIDREHCIGCGSCENACPYGAITLYTGRKLRDMEPGKAYKCDGCSENYSDTPQCVLNCPSGALSFDYRLKIIKEAEKRVLQINEGPFQAEVYGLREHGGTNVLAILKEKSLIQLISRNRVKKTDDALALYRILSYFTGRRRFYSRNLFKSLTSLVSGKKKV